MIIGVLSFSQYGGFLVGCYSIIYSLLNEHLDLEQVEKRENLRKGVIIMNISNPGRSNNLFLFSGSIT